MRKTTSGFTIVELLIVVVVIAILAAISVVTYSNIQDRARNSIVKLNLSNTVKALELFSVENGRYPFNSTDVNQVRQTLTLTQTKSNTLLYCVDAANPTSWLILAGGYPDPVYRWTSAGERNYNSGAVIGSGGITCQAQMGVATATGWWAMSIAILQ